MRPGRIDLTKTPIRYTYADAREMTNAYNRAASYGAMLPTRLTAAQIHNGPLKNGDQEAYKWSLFYGLRHADNSLTDEDVDNLLGNYIKSPARGGKGGKLLDFLPRIREALVDCGVVEISEVPDDADAEAGSGGAVPTVRVPTAE